MKDLTNVINIFPGFLGSEDPVKLDQGIRDTIRGVGHSILCIGIGLVRMKSEKYFIKLKYKNMSAYINGLAKDLKMDTSSIYNRLRIGKTYLKYREELENIGFDAGDGVSKLPYLERALAKRPKEEVFLSLMAMGQREFMDYARSQPGEKPVSDKNLKFQKWELRGYILYIDGKRAIILNKDLDEKTIRMLLAAMRASCRALEREGVILAVHLNNNEELRRFARIAKRERKKMREKR